MPVSSRLEKEVNHMENGGEGNKVRKDGEERKEEKGKSKGRGTKKD